MVDLDTRLLRAFVTVAEELNFTRAAERLVLAQQALSAQIRQLETRLGVRLFERTTRRVRLTEAGELLLPHARAVVEALDAGMQELEAARRVAGAVLRVGLSGTATVPLTSETMRRFSERHPEVRLVVSNAGLNRPAAGLHEGAVDVAFVRPPFRDEGLSMVTVLTEERFAVLPEDHPLASREAGARCGPGRASTRSRRRSGRSRRGWRSRARPSRRCERWAPAFRSCASCDWWERCRPTSRSPGALRTKPSWPASSCAWRSRSARRIDNRARSAGGRIGVSHP